MIVIVSPAGGRAAATTHSIESRTDPATETSQSMSCYSVLPVEDVDIERVADVVCDGIVQGGLTNSQFVAATWPGLDTPEGRVEARSRFRLLRAHLKEPQHFLKVVDEKSGETVATAICFYNPEPPKKLPDPTGDGWKSEDDRNHAFHLKRERDALLLRLFGRLQGPVTEILAFFVDPSRHRQGIGTLLMKHLINVDAQRGKPLVLIAHPPAVGFYQKLGFEVNEDVVLSVPPQWQNRPPARLISLLHEP